MKHEEARRKKNCDGIIIEEQECGKQQAGTDTHAREHARQPKAEEEVAKESLDDDDDDENLNTSAPGPEFCL